MSGLKLSQKLKLFRADRPDEWTMDVFIRHAKELEASIKQHDLALLKSIVQEFADSEFSCELILASRIHDLELEK